MRERSAVDYFACLRDRPALVIGNGPSAWQIVGRQQEIKSKFVTIGMNRSWQLIDADYHVIMFHHEHLDDLVKRRFFTPSMTLWTYKDYSEMWTRHVNVGNVVYVPSVADPKSPMHEFNLAGMLSLDLSDCSYADMTGMFAIEVALWMHPAPIFLIGFDLYGGHFCDDLKPEDEWRDTQVDLFNWAAEQIDVEAPWASVYNCNPESKISGFKKITLEEALEWPSGN